jgi:hypothetical protein
MLPFVSAVIPTQLINRFKCLFGRHEMVPLLACNYWRCRHCPYVDETSKWIDMASDAGGDRSYREPVFVIAVPAPQPSARSPADRSRSEREDDDRV